MNNLIKTVIINEQEIEIKQYLPVNEKLRLIGDVIAQAADENNFSNPIKLEVFTKLEIVFTYTNLSFTEKQKETYNKWIKAREDKDFALADTLREKLIKENIL